MVPTNGAPSAEDSKQQLDSVKKALKAAISESDDVSAVVGRDAVPALVRLLGRQTSASDSTWVYINLVYAYGFANEPARACLPLREAKRLAKSGQQLQAIADLVNTGALTCAP